MKLVPTLPRSTATTRLSPKAARHRRRQGVANIRSRGLSPSQHSPDGATAHILLLIYWPRKDERLSWPSWLTCSGRFTHIVVTRRLQAERRTWSVRRPKTGVLPTVLRNRFAADTFFTLRCELDLWPCDLDRWPWTFAGYRPWRDKTMCQIWTQSSNPRLSYSDFNIWPYDLEHVLRVALGSIIIFTRLVRQLIRAWMVAFFMLIRYFTLWPWHLTRWPWMFVIH